MSFDSKLLTKDFIYKLDMLNNNLANALYEHNYEVKLIGNLFYRDQLPNFHLRAPCLEMEFKRQRLHEVSKRSSSVFEIGVNGGHSALLILASNPILSYVGNDICEFYDAAPICHPEVYIPRGIKILKRLFEDRVSFLIGDCLTKVPQFVKLNPKVEIDFLHLDGAKDTYTKDFFNILPLLKKGAFVVLDDSNDTVVEKSIQQLMGEEYLERSKDFPSMNQTFLWRNEILVYTGK